MAANRLRGREIRGFQDNGPMASFVPTYLRCEYLVNPLAIDTTSPRLSWILEPTERTLRALRQTAYQILVASTPDKLAHDQGDAWDSGKIPSDATNQVEYAGSKLQPGRPYCWKVRSWDQDGAPSDWSQPATWALGVDPQAWQAQWVGAAQAPSAKDAGPSPMVRKTFDLGKNVKRAIAYASALGMYELHINGRRIGDQVLSPEWTDYTKRIQYQAYDVTALLKAGKNAIGAMLGEGWYAGRVGLTHIVKDGPIRHLYGDRPRLFVQLHIELADGTTQVVVTDGTWRYTTDGPIRHADILDGETYDASREMPGWDTAGFDDAAWQPVDVLRQAKGKLVAQPNEPIRVTRQLRPVSVKEVQPGTWVFDLGQNIAGWCKLRLREPAGTTIRLRHSEMLNEDGTLYRTNLRMPADGGPLGARQEDHYVTKGGSEEIFEPHFTYHGFQYVELTGLTTPATLEMITGCPVYSAATEVGDFESSSPMLNRLFSNIFWTQRDNLPSIPTDCPQRDERLGWTGDMQVFSQTAMFNMDMAAFFTKWVPDLRDAQADDGRFPDVAPHPYNPNERFSGVAAWGDVGTVVPWRVWLNYGDKRLLAEHFKAATRWVDWIRQNNPDLVWQNQRNNDYGDWLHGDTLKAPGWPRTGGEVPKEIFATAFFAHSADLVARMARVLGLSKEADKYAELHTQIKAAFQDRFVHANGRICGNTQAGYALALAFDLLPETLRPAAAKHMVDDVARYNGHMSTGFNSTIRMMLELTRWGYNDLAYNLVNCTTFPSWGYMIENGATSIWERWDGYVKGRGFQDPGMNSFCHYAIGSVGEWMYRVILGINPDEREVGYKHVVIRPIPGGKLDYAKGQYASIRGKIATAWKRDGNRLCLDITIPANVTATVHVPATSAKNVTEGGKPAGQAPGVKFVNMAEGSAIYEVGSGEYRFVAAD
jgi:alpha-L-rhamnosidase